MPSSSKKSRFSKNVIANFLGRIWSMISVFIFIPLYIRYLGEEAYGLVTFFATLSSTMNLLGLGLTNTIRREFASGDDTDQTRLYKYQILRSVELIYFCIALLIIVICFFGSEFIASKWLNIGSLDFSTVTFTIRLMGVSIAIQLIAYMYSGCLYGLEHQVSANIYQSIWSLIKNLGVVLIISLIAGDIRLFYIWHIITDFCYLLILRMKIIKLLKCNIKFRWNLADVVNLKKIWKFALGVLLVSLVATLNTQMDKLVISKFMSLLELGAYNIAYSLGQLTSILATAIGTAAFSRFTVYYTTDNSDQLKTSFVMFNKLAGMTVIAIGTFVAVFSYELILYWTGNDSIADLLQGSAIFVIIGCLFSSLQIVPYEFMLSQGNTRINNILGIACIPYLLLITPFLVRKFGIYGAAFSWCNLMVLSTCIYLSYIHYKYIGSGTIKWIVKDILIPFVYSLFMANISKWLTKYLYFSLIQSIVFAVFAGTIILLSMFIIFDNSLAIYLKSKINSINDNGM